MDYRDVAAHHSSLGPLFKDVNERHMTAMVELDGGDVQVHLCYCVCDTCGGRGKYVNPSVDAHGISAEEFAEDPDFAEEYFRGRYDITCRTCNGERVQLTLDEDNNPPEIVEQVRRREQERWDYAREITREREMGY